VSFSEPALALQGSRSRLYNVSFQFKPTKEWPIESKQLSFKKVCNALENSFIPQLLGAIRKELKMKKTKGIFFFLQGSFAHQLLTCFLVVQ